jgi:hypothetical protein
LKVTVDVRFGSKADIASIKPYVRFTPKSGHAPGNGTQGFPAKVIGVRFRFLEVGL